MNYETDEDGFLLDPDDWDENVANQIAELEDVSLTHEHWNIIRIIRTYYYEYGSVPELRKILKQLKAELGSEKSTRKYVYKLFPYGYGQHGCKIAGTRQPRKFWLDL